MALLVNEIEITDRVMNGGLIGTELFHDLWARGERGFMLAAQKIQP
jgi:hypothetical protein